MGLTAVALFVSPWDRRSGAHINPAVTLGFWMLGRISTPDAIAYVAAQFAGAGAGVLAASAALGRPFTTAPVNYIVTMPGPRGAGVAFAAECLLAFTLLLTVLLMLSRRRLQSVTPYVTGVLVAAFVAFESPLSGMSINPARSIASAAAAGLWAYWWIYALAPTLGMLAAVIVFRRTGQTGGCAKLLHDDAAHCIHCGQPARPVALDERTCRGPVR